MDRIRDIRNWLQREPYEDMNFFALLAAEGLTPGAAALRPVHPLSPVERVAAWAADTLEDYRSLGFGFLDFLACNSSAASMAPVGWNPVADASSAPSSVDCDCHNDNEPPRAGPKGKEEPRLAA